VASRRGCTVEIQRLDRTLAAGGQADLEALGERTVWLDCDVLPGPTAETRLCFGLGAYVAANARPRALRSRPRADRLGRRGLGGDSRRRESLLDLDYGEDSSAEVDMNLRHQPGDGRPDRYCRQTAEIRSLRREELDELLALAASGAETIKAAQEEALKAAEVRPARLASTFRADLKEGRCESQPRISAATARCAPRAGGCVRGAGQ